MPMSAVVPDGVFAVESFNRIRCSSVNVGTLGKSLWKVNSRFYNNNNGCWPVCLTRYCYASRTAFAYANYPHMDRQLKDMNK